MRRPLAILWSCGMLAALGTPAGALAHGGATVDYRARILDVTPHSLPIDVRIEGDRMAVRNEGEELLVICNGDEGECRGRELRPGDRALITDERLHWVGGADTLPPGVDERDPDPQKVFDVDIPVSYGSQEGTIRARLDYVGGRTWLQAYGEYALLALAVVVMLAVFAMDARRRRTSARAEAAADEQATD